MQSAPCMMLASVSVLSVFVKLSLFPIYISAPSSLFRSSVRGSSVETESLPSSGFAAQRTPSQSDPAVSALGKPASLSEVTTGTINDAPAIPPSSVDEGTGGSETLRVVM